MDGDVFNEIKGTRGQKIEYKHLCDFDNETDFSIWFGAFTATKKWQK
jgi:hypothetical protein